LLRRVGFHHRRRAAAKFPEALPARMNGADFALLLPGQSPDASSPTNVLDALVKAMEPFADGGPSAYIGVGGFDAAPHCA
jgi:hypothetical protein